MARGINKVILIGNLGNDPEVRYTPSGVPVASLSLATTETWRDKQSGENQERTEWHRVVFFNRLAEIVGEYLKKGSKVYIEGSLRTRKWQDKNGQDRYTTEIVAAEMQMLDAKSSGASDKSTGSNHHPLHHEASEPTPTSHRNVEPSVPFNDASASQSDIDDDIPF